MERYYFHIRGKSDYIEDLGGTEFPDLATAISEGQKAAREIIAEKLLKNEAFDNEQFEIADDTECVHAVVVWTDAMKTVD